MRGLPWDYKFKAGSDIDSAIEPSRNPPPRAISVAPEGEIYHRPFKIYKQDLQLYGYTPQCPGCIAARNEQAQRPHNNACRNRIREKLMETEAGKRRIAASDERMKQLRSETAPPQEVAVEGAPRSSPVGERPQKQARISVDVD